MLNFKENSSVPPLVLADFSEGSMQAATFAVSFLWEKNNPLYILQTYKSPAWGHFMTRNLSLKLKEITLNELKYLKKKLLKECKIEDQNIEILSIEGDLNSVLQFKPAINKEFNVVIGTCLPFKNSCSMQNHCLEKIIDTSKSPLYLIAGEINKEQTKRLLFVGNQSKPPSKQLVSKLLSICRITCTELEVLFVLNKKNPFVSELVIDAYSEIFDSIKVSVNQISNPSKCNGIMKYLENEHCDIIIIDNQK